MIFEGDESLFTLLEFYLLTSFQCFVYSSVIMNLINKWRSSFDSVYQKYIEITFPDILIIDDNGLWGGWSLLDEIFYWRNSWAVFEYGFIISDTRIKWRSLLDSIYQIDPMSIPHDYFNSSDDDLWGGWSLLGEIFCWRNFGIFLSIAPYISVLWSNEWYHSIQYIK
jgi:hypothetical protein